jgi:hypothetical protein
MDVRVKSATLGGTTIAGGGNGIVVTGFGWTKAPRTQRRARPRGHGSVDLTRYYDGRLYHLSGLIYGVSEADAQARLDALEQELALDGDSVRFTWLLAGRTEPEWADVRVDGDLTYEFAADSRSVIKWALTLFSGDPRRYGSSQRIASYDPTTAGSGAGLQFPVSFPLTFPGVEVSNLKATNAGNFETPPVLTITGPVTNPTIDNDTTGESIVTTGLTLAAGEEAVIDVGAKTLTLAGTQRPDLIDASATTWFGLKAGTNLLRLRGTGMSSGETELAVSFHDARI